MARRNDQTKSRRTKTASRGRRVTSQGGMQGSNVARNDVFPMVEKLAHQNQQQNPIIASMQRFYAGQSPTGLKPINPGGPNQQQNVNPGGPVKSPGPGGKVNPGGPNNNGGGGGNPWAGTGVSGPGVGQQLGIKGWTVPQWEQDWMNHPNRTPDVPGWSGVNPGGPMQGGGMGGNWNTNPGGGGGNYWTQKRMDNARPMGNPEGFDPRGLQVNPGGPNNGGGGGTNHNHGGSQHDHQGGGPGHTHDTGGGQNGGDVPQYVQNWSPAHPDAFARRFPTYADYTSGVQDPRRQSFYDYAMSQQSQAPAQPGPQGHQQRRRRQGGGGGGAGGGQSQQPQPDFSQPPSSQPPASQPPAGTPPIVPPTSGGVSPFLGNTSYSGEFTNANPSGNYLQSNIPVQQGIGQGSYAPAGAGGSADVFTYDTFAGGHTYEPMPGGATSGPGNANYPFQGYAPPPSNVGYFDQGNGWDFGNTNHTPMAWSQYAQTLGAQNDLQPYFQQKLAPPNAQGVWWSNPVVTDPGYYDPWVELRNLQQHFGDAEAGNVAASKALGTYASSQGQLDYYRYLAHQANIPGYAQMTGPLAVGYHSPNVGGTYGAPATYG